MRYQMRSVRKPGFPAAPLARHLQVASALSAPSTNIAGEHGIVRGGLAQELGEVLKMDGFVPGMTCRELIEVSNMRGICAGLETSWHE
jgi:hypothetical protein